MNEQDTEITPLGFCNFRNQKTQFGIKVDDRRRHIYIVGKTGVGKTTAMENMIIADIRSGRGVGVVDPHGELADKIVEFIPEERLDDVIYFNPADMDYPIAFNPIEQVGTEFRHLVASGIMGVFKKIWPDVWSARMEYILNNTLLALLEYPSSTLLGIMRMLSEPPYRKKIVENLKDPVIRAFWVNEFARYTQRLETEAVAAIQNKVGQFVSNPLIRNILGQPHSTLNMRELMDKKKIFIVNLSKGKIGEDNSALLGAMVITRLQLAAMSRVDMAEEKREDFFLYVDEFQNFATESFANILSEARKYRLSLTLAHQYIGQLVHEQNTRVRDAVFGNVGTIVCFRVGGADAEFLEKEFMPEFLQNDLVNLGKANIYIKLMIDGVASRPFSAETLPPQKIPLVSFKDVIVKNSRERYGTPRKVVEEKIASEWQTAGESLVGEKIGRQNERTLRETMQPGNYQAFRPRPRYDGRGGANTVRDGARDGANAVGEYGGGEGRFRERRSNYPQSDYHQSERGSAAAYPNHAAPRPSAPVPPATAKTRPPETREKFQHQKPDINVEELRRAIKASLGPEKETPAATHPESEKRQENYAADENNDMNKNSLYGTDEDRDELGERTPEKLAEKEDLANDSKENGGDEI